MTLFDVTVFLSDWADYLSLFAALVSWFYRDTNAFFKWLHYYLVVLSLLQFSSTILAIYEINNWFVYQLMGLSEIIFLYLIYRSLGMNKKWKYVFIAVLSVYLFDAARVIITDLQRGAFEENEAALFVNNYGLGLVMLFGIVLGINFLWRTYLKEEVVDLGKYAPYYICAGLFFYSAGSFFYYLLSSSITPMHIQDYVSYYSWLLVVGSTYIKLIFIFLGFRYAKNGQ